MIFSVHVAKLGRDPRAPDLRFSASFFLMYTLPVLCGQLFLQERQSSNKSLCFHLHEVIHKWACELVLFCMFFLSLKLMLGISFPLKKTGLYELGEMNHLKIVRLH